jgi:hypothetical protein
MAGKLDNHHHFYLWKVDASTGVAQTICETQDWLGGGTWSRDGRILFSQAKFSGPNSLPQARLYRVSAAGGEVQPESMANCYGRADFTGAAQVNWLSLSERIRWQ